MVIGAKVDETVAPVAATSREVDSGVSEDSGSSHSEEDEEKKPTKSKGN
jgi:hypothetical protein